MARWCLACLAPVAFALVLTASPTKAQRRFFIDEETRWEPRRRPCSALDDVNTATAYLAAAMRSEGWTGVRGVNATSFPQDFFEPTLIPSGLEATRADSAPFVAYAGHGSVFGAVLSFGRPTLGICFVNLPNNTRLGTLAGDQAAVAAYITSCTMSRRSGSGTPANYTFVFNDEIHQHMGFHNSPDVGNEASGYFFLCTIRAGTNEDCWLLQMESDPDLFDYNNSPLAMSHGTTVDDAMAKRRTCALAREICNGPAVEPWQFYEYDLILNRRRSNPCI